KLSALALSAAEGFGRMERNEGADTFGSKLKDLATEGSEGSVQITTLDAYCAANGVQFIDILKIDVEGRERDVIKGAENLLNAKKIAVLILETDHRLVDFYQSLQARGFHLFYYDYRNNNLEEIFPISEATLLNEPTPFSSNIVLIQGEELDKYK